MNVVGCELLFDITCSSEIRKLSFRVVRNVGVLIFVVMEIVLLV